MEKRPTNRQIRGRGATISPANRFEALRYELDAGCEPETEPHPVKTQFFRDDSQSIISYNNSPDLGFDASLNPYRGCEHGCAYCYARPTHEYLGFSAGIDFESRILVKPRAAELLAAELARPSWIPQILVLSGVTDAYQPIERKLQITRSCLRVLAEFRNPVSIVTKNHLVTRDVDYLAELASHHAVAVSLSITTLESGLAQILEPRAATPSHRLDAIAKLRAAGVPVGVNIAPIIPGLNDHEIPKIAEAAAAAGAESAHYTIIRLPLTVAPVFVAWLEDHFPDRKDKILGRIRSMRNGKLNTAEFGARMRGDGPFAEQIRQIFHVSCRRSGLSRPRSELSTAAFRRVLPNQLEFSL
ncbi:MAG: PA0069 family radical SAM protein [Verrucomicrobia bacterium]|nr:PA0069 family radical SAM protein [Verrucomicrobiota bacterium]